VACNWDGRSRSRQPPNPVHAAQNPALDPIPIGHQTRDRGHGRREIRTVKAVTVTTPGGIGFPHAEQSIRITRTTTRSGKTGREIAYLTISLPATGAQPIDLQDWIRREWLIEALHHVSDVTFREDSHQARTGNGPDVMAALRNTAIGYHRTSGETNIARAAHAPTAAHTT